MIIRNTEKAAEEIQSSSLWSEDGNVSGDAQSAFEEILEKSASDNSLLIFLTDTDGEILSSTDEHSGLYESSRENYNDRHAEAETSSANPYLTSGNMSGWMIGASRYLSLPWNYSSYLSELLASADGRLGILTEDSGTYICCRLLQKSGPSSAGRVLFISTSLGDIAAARHFYVISE